MAGSKAFLKSKRIVRSRVLFTWITYLYFNYNTVNDRLSAAALIKVFRFLGAALIRLRRLFDCGAYFKD